MNSRNRPSRLAGSRPPHTRKRVWAIGAALLALGLVGCQGAGEDDADTARTAASRPTPAITVTATVTVTTTAEPTHAPTVTKTKTVTRPGPTVTVTKAAQAAGSGSGSGGGTCSIVSNSGNCYQAGQFCRNSDHGAATTTAGGTRITCAYSANAWRWIYS
ncbi:hypothetical protein AB0E64_15590 [Streptomyces caelestis]|uniref:Uncharacterized protein n=1 Tax=Streptomyces caelestis TaxID=36816 RepID=A0A7W9HBL3_9ACTN|nr:hypothetical protein [Streptomyces caelestis]MBB5799282.1 hypothetical protein [Streptomyces caelestis]